MGKFKTFRKETASKFKTLKEFFSNAYNKHIILMYIGVAVLITLIIEIMARTSLIGAIAFLISTPYVFICNALIVLMTMSITLLMRRRLFGFCLIGAIWIIFGISNCVLMVNRVTPFTAVDLMLIDSALQVMNKYFEVWQVVLCIIGIVLLIVGLIILFIKAPKVNHKIQYVRNLIGIVIIVIITFLALQLGLASKVIPQHFGNLRQCYTDYGFVYCFSNSLVNTGIRRPSDYSEETIKKILTGKSSKKKVEKKPNIIFVQLESFFDLKHMKGVKFSKDPCPNFTKMKQKYPSGFFNVPIVGAGTVNTEFEVITGMNLDDFGPGEYPFKTKLTDTSCESIAFNLKNYKYKPSVVHDNTATFYSRNEVYANLGFDIFQSIENIKHPTYTPMGWAKDYCLTHEILDMMDSTVQQDLIYTISVQGHGSYPDTNRYNYPVAISGLRDEEMKNQFEYYAWQVYEMDDFIKQLTDKLAKRKEKTIVVIYGDHLPTLGITAEDLDNKNIYQTEYVIWSNFKTKYKNEDVEAYQMESKILKPLRMTAGKINRYTQVNKDKLPESKYLKGLKALSYDQLYGDHLASDGKVPYTPTNMQFGIHPVSITAVVPLNDAEKNVYIYGRNFTEYSKVYINDEKVSTAYVDDTTLRIIRPGLQVGDAIQVYQQNSDTHVLSKTSPFKYAQENIPAYTTKHVKKKKKK
ncbi:MAG: sulfatase-like hydrolase/transferase [Eubacterium sp.]|nr:sulfatase-like hydrolase/transferase [Eubacterium sp.]